VNDTEYYKKWRAENLEKCRQYSKHYRERHKDKLVADRRQYNLLHKEERAYAKAEIYKSHREEILARCSLYRQTNRALLRERSKTERYKLKLEVLTQYGNGKAACVKCEFSDPRALSIDHVNGGGTAHRRKLGSHLYLWLKHNHYPNGFQTLCLNCQFIKKMENKETKCR
jgi:hypothetical protein